jgi:hypothetical protein
MQKSNNEVRSAIGIGVVLVAIGVVSFATSQIVYLSQSFVFSMVTSNIFVLGVSIGAFVLLYKRPISQMGFALADWGLKLLFGALVGIAAISVCFAAFVIAGWGKIGKVDICLLHAGDLSRSKALRMTIHLYNACLRNA